VPTSRQIGADGTARTGTVFDDELLLQVFRQLLGDQAPGNIGSASHREPDHQSYRLDWIFGRESVARKRSSPSQQG
jgi:hypothetical protein